MSSYTARSVTAHPSGQEHWPLQPLTRHSGCGSPPQVSLASVVNSYESQDWAAAKAAQLASLSHGYAGTSLMQIPHSQELDEELPPQPERKTAVDRNTKAIAAGTIFETFMMTPLP
jgi:hypothetical protein